MRWRSLSLPTPTLRRLNRGSQVATLGVLVAGVLTLNASVAISALLALAVTFLPAWLERDVQIVLVPSLTVWPTVAVLLHAIGMLGPYDTFW